MSSGYFAIHCPCCSYGDGKPVFTAISYWVKHPYHNVPLFDVCPRCGYTVTTNLDGETVYGREAVKVILKTHGDYADVQAHTLLRKSGLQPRRKVQAVQNALTTNSDLASMLCIETEVMPLHILSWIVDTSIEHDHERFNGFLKVSLEELLIALHDDRHLLNDPDGFSSSRFVAVIESEAVWEESVH